LSVTSPPWRTRRPVHFRECMMGNWELILWVTGSFWIVSSPRSKNSKGNVNVDCGYTVRPCSGLRRTPQHYCSTSGTYQGGRAGRTTSCIVVRFEVLTAVTMKNVVFRDIITKFLPQRKHYVSTTEPSRLMLCKI
jgi:hypothetical protein